MHYSYNRTKVELRLETLNADLSKLFENYSFEEKSQVKAQIESVQEYYNISCEKTGGKETVYKILTDYERLITQLATIKTGNIDYKYMLDTAYATIDYAVRNRRNHAIYANLVKACEIMFWASVAVTLLSAFFSISLPILIFQPIIGVPIMLATCGALLKTLENLIQCFSAFTKFERHEAQRSNAKELFGFFKPEERTPEVRFSDVIEEIPLNDSHSLP